MSLQVAGRSRRRSAVADTWYGQEGGALLWVVITLGLVALLVTVSLNAALSHLGRAQKNRDSLSAYYLAEAGAQKALVELDKVDYDLTALAPIAGEEETGTFSVQVQPEGNNLVVASTGRSHAATRTIEVRLALPPSGVVFAGKNVSIRGYLFWTTLETDVWAGNGVTMDVFTWDENTGAETATFNSDDGLFAPGYSAREHVPDPVPRVLTSEAVESFYQRLVQGGQLVTRSEQQLWGTTVLMQDTHYTGSVTVWGTLRIPEGVTMVADGRVNVLGNLDVDGTLYVRSSTSNALSAFLVSGSGAIVTNGNAEVATVGSSAPQMFALKTGEEDTANDVEVYFAGAPSLVIYADGDITVSGLGLGENLATSLMAQGSIDLNLLSVGARLTRGGFRSRGLPFRLRRATIVSWKEQ